MMSSWRNGLELFEAMARSALEASTWTLAQLLQAPWRGALRLIQRLRRERKEEKENLQDNIIT